jgi:hypothetical protein
MTDEEQNHWDIAPCSVVEVDRRFRGAYCLHLIPELVIILNVRTRRGSLSRTRFPTATGTNFSSAMHTQPRI